MLPACFLVVPAMAVAAITVAVPSTATSSRTEGLLRTFFNFVSSLSLGGGFSEGSSSPKSRPESSRKQPWARYGLGSPHEDKPRNLGLRRHGDPLQPGWLQAGAGRSGDRRQGANGGRRARRPDRRLRGPLAAGVVGGQPRRRARRARRARHLLHGERAPPRPPLRKRRPLLTGRRDADGGASAHRRGDRPRGGGRRAHDRLARDRGLQLPVPAPLRR